MELVRAQGFSQGMTLKYVRDDEEHRTRPRTQMMTLQGKQKSSSGFSSRPHKEGAGNSQSQSPSVSKESSPARTICLDDLKRSLARSRTLRDGQTKVRDKDKKNQKVDKYDVSASFLVLKRKCQGRAVQTGAVFELTHPSRVVFASSSTELQSCLFSRSRPVSRVSRRHESEVKVVGCVGQCPRCLLDISGQAFTIQLNFSIFRWSRRWSTFFLLAIFRCCLIESCVTPFPLFSSFPLALLGVATGTLGLTSLRLLIFIVSSGHRRLVCRTPETRVCAQSDS